MREALENLVKGLLRVPPEPQPPLGGPGSLRRFRAARGFFRYRLLSWVIGQAGAIIGLIAGVVFLREFVSVAGFWQPFIIIELLGVAFFLMQLPISFLMITLDYKYRWYMVTDRGLRIREGVLKVQERTMSFSNIQKVSVRQGPLQRLFGISDVEVRTAGGSDASPGGNHQQSASDNLHLGYFRGVDNAAEIRDAILAHLKQLRTSGLGDPDEPVDSEVVPAVADDLLEAGRQLLAEAQALRRVAG